MSLNKEIRLNQFRMERAGIRIDSVDFHSPYEIYGFINGVN